MTVGVYALRNCAKRLVYIGSSLNLEGRQRDWSSALGRIERDLSYTASVPRVVAIAAKGTLRCEWEFVVLKELPLDTPTLELRQFEHEAMLRASQLYGEGCLNSLSAPVPLRFASGSLDDF